MLGLSSKLDYYIVILRLCEVVTSKSLSEFFIVS